MERPYRVVRRHSSRPRIGGREAKKWTDSPETAAEETEIHKTVCDVLALRRDNGRSTPILSDAISGIR
jgi:hypothetical protein